MSDNGPTIINIYGPDMPVEPRTFEGWLKYLRGDMSRWIVLVYNSIVMIVFVFIGEWWLFAAVASITIALYWFSWNTSYRSQLWMEAKKRAYDKHSSEKKIYPWNVPPKSSPVEPRPAEIAHGAPYRQRTLMELLRHEGGGQLVIYNEEGKFVRPLAQTFFNNWRDRDRMVLLWNDDERRKHTITGIEHAYPPTARLD